MTKCCQFLPAAVFLWSLLSSACGAQIWANRTRDGLRCGLQDLKMPSGSPGAERASRQKRSSPPCLAGHYLNMQNNTCLPCRKRTFQPHPNSDTRCRSCKICQQIVMQVEKNCTNTSNTVCGCKVGYYKQTVMGRSAEFECRKCTNCLEQHREIRRNCSQAEDAGCGGCLPGYAKNGTECCENPRTAPCDENCHPGLEPASRHGYWLLLLVAPCLVGALAAYYCKCRRCTEESLAAGPLPSVSPVVLQVDRGPLLRGSLCQGRHLYAIIDVVPVRRWKEFVRGLGLRDGEIEAVELEHGQLREQQYEMLKRWRQCHGATAEAIFAVLEDMQLGGCAQELRELLQPEKLGAQP